MDSKGRPTKLEDIISPEELEVIINDDSACRGEYRTDPTWSNGILKIFEDFAAYRIPPTVLLQIVLDPQGTIARIIMTTVVCIDDAIRRKAELAELDEINKDRH